MFYFPAFALENDSRETRRCFGRIDSRETSKLDGWSADFHKTRLGVVHRD